MLCYYYNKTNHTFIICYFKHGLPIGHINNLHVFVNKFEGRQSKCNNHTNVPSNINEKDYQYLLTLWNLPRLMLKKLLMPTKFLNLLTLFRALLKHVFLLLQILYGLSIHGASDHVFPITKYFSLFQQIKHILIIFPNDNNSYAYILALLLS